MIDQEAPCPFKTKVIVVLQLCLAFSLICWYLSYPFMGHLFAIKSQQLILKKAMGTSKYDERTVNLNNQNRFLLLPKNQQITLQRYSAQLKKEGQNSFGKKLCRAVHILAFEISPLEQMWIVFSIIVPLLFLLNIEGAQAAALLLPLITTCYALDNQWNGYHKVSKEATLFPSEQQIIQEYMEEPLNSNIAIQRKQLTQGFENYLIDRWTHEVPSQHPHIRKKQKEQGEYAFNVARALAKSLQFSERGLDVFRRKEPLVLIITYLLWNLFFAWIVQKKQKKLIWQSVSV